MASRVDATIRSSMDAFALEGLIPAAHTPFRKDGAIDLDRVPDQARHLLRHQLQTVFIAGSTGESHSLTIEERRHLTARWTEVARGTPLRIIVHVGSNCLSDACALAAHAQEAGASAVAALAPSYFKPRDLDALIACCAAIAVKAPALPFYFYDIPALTGVSLPMPEFLERASRVIPTLAGIKFTNLDFAQLQLCLDLKSHDIAWGVDEALIGALACGVRSAVGSTYNFAAPIAQRLVDAFHRGDLETARREQLRLVRLVAALARHGYLAAAKYLMERLGVEVGPPRLPLTPLRPEQIQVLEDDLARLGFEGWM